MPVPALTEQPTAGRLAYSPSEAARALSISRAKLYQLLDDGSLASVKLGSRRLIRCEAIVALLDRLETGFTDDEAEHGVVAAVAAAGQPEVA